MSPLAAMFGGQGGQHVGMAELVRRLPRGGELLERADRALGFALSEIMSRGSAMAIRDTAVAQPALLCAGVAYGQELLTRATPRVMLGHSLGQYSALVVADSIDFESAVQLVHQRGLLMQRTVPLGVGAMAAIIGSSLQEVDAACKAVSSTHGQVGVACDNAPGQVVISGLDAAVGAAVSRLEEEGATGVPLNVSAPFHTALLAPMRAEFARLIGAIEIRPPRFAVIDNVTADVLTDVDQIRASLVEHLTRPVRFRESLERAAQLGVTCFTQCSPGEELLGLVKRTIRTAARASFSAAIEESAHAAAQ